MRIRVLLVLVLLALLAATVFFLHWAGQRPPARYLSDLRSQVYSAENLDAEGAHLLLLRPQLYPLDYQSPHHLELKLTAALEHARADGLLRGQTLVVLPEHIGTWLIAVGEKAEFYRADSRQEVRDWLLLGNPLLAVRVLLHNLDAQRLDEALLRMKAPRMAQDYQQLFANLARRYQVTLLAGSILLPAPSLPDGQLQAGDGELRNLSLVFGPDGNVLQLFSEPWPWRAEAPQQSFEFAGQRLTVERDWTPGFAQSRIRLEDGRLSPPLFLRGKLAWPIGGAPRHVALTPEDAPQAGEAPGSHLLAQPLTP